MMRMHFNASDSSKQCLATISPALSRIEHPSYSGCQVEDIKRSRLFARSISIVPVTHLEE